MHFIRLPCKILLSSLGLSLLPVIAGETSQARIDVILPSSDSSQIHKQIFNLEAYATLACPLNRTKAERAKDFRGQLIHREANRLSAQPISLRVSSEEPLMLSGLFSQIGPNRESEICYYQSQSFWPQANTHYTIQFHADCQVTGIQWDDNKQSTPLTLNNVLDSCFPAKP